MALPIVKQPTEVTRKLLPQTVGFLRSHNVSQKIPASSSVSQAISVIACQMFQELLINNESAKELKAYTYTVINRSLNWLCEQGCDIYDPEDITYGNRFVEMINRCANEWQIAATKMTRVLKTKEQPKIEQILGLLTTIKAEMEHNLQLLRRDITQGRSKISTGLHMGEEIFDKIMHARLDCPWHESLQSKLGTTSETSEHLTPDLLEKLLFSLNLMLNDTSDARRNISEWPKIEEAIRPLMLSLEMLVKNVKKEKKLTSLFPEISRLLEALSELLTRRPACSVSQLSSMMALPSSSSVSALSPSNNCSLISDHSIFTKPALYYGWGAIKHALEQTVAPIQSAATESIELSQDSLARTDHILDNLTDWLDVFDDQFSSEDRTDLSRSLKVAIDLSQAFVSQIKPSLEKLRSWIQSHRSESHVTQDSLQELKKHQTELVGHLDRMLSILESPLLSYDNARDYLPIQEIRSRQRRVQGSLGSFADRVQFQSLGELTEDQRKDVFDWLTTFWIPLHAMIEELQDLSVTPEIEEPKEPISLALKPPSPPKQSSSRKKHKKKKVVPFLSESPEAPAPLDLPPLKAAAETQPLPAPSVLPALPQEPAKSLMPMRVTKKEADAPRLTPPPKAAPSRGAVAPAPQKKKHDASEHIDNFRKLKRLLEEYGFRQESGGRHLKFVNEAGGKIAVPYHGGSGSIAKGTLSAIIRRARELSERLDHYIEKLSHSES